MSQPARKYLGQTVEVKAAHRIDEARLAQFLGDVVPDYAGPLEVKQFEGGQSNPTYLLTTPGAKYVLRRKPPGVLLKSAHAVDREFRVMRALSEHDTFVRDDARADDRVRSRASETTACVRHRPPHPPCVVRRGLRRHDGYHFSWKSASTYSCGENGIRSSMPSPTPT